MSCHLPNLRRLAIVSAFTALLAAGCTPIQLQDDAVQTAGEALSAARELSPGVETQRFLLRSAADFQEQGDHDSARRILRAEAFGEPADEMEDQYLLLSLKSAAALEDRQWAEAIAADLPPRQYQEYPEDLQAEAARLQEAIYQLAGAHLKNTQLLIGAEPELLDIDRQQLNDRIWQALKKVPDSALEQATTSAIGFESQGWYELASTLRQPDLTFEEQGRAVRNWQLNWIGHSGTEILPSELTIMARVLEDRPERITLALPLSGPLSAAGNMVREGFLAAYYASTTPREQKEGNSGDNGDTGGSPQAVDVTINVVDTNGRSMEALMPELMADNPDLIVGPLSKEQVATLANQRELPVPVLALNYAPAEDRPRSPQLFQFGLSVEDEARQIAERIVEEGLGQALVLIPRGDWGDRIASALEKHMEELGGTILDMDRYSEEDNFRDVTAELLGINVSRERAIDVERTIGQNIEFEARRRQDAESIVMVAEPVVARQFKPLFSFYYAGNVPVFSPSVIYSGRPEPSRDRDLNGVHFTDLPWILDRKPDFRQEAYEQFDNLDGPLGRLFAMGADAWTLSTRLPLMQQVSDTRVDGHTGELWLDENNRVHRSQMWGVFRDGVPVIATEEAEAPEEPVELIETGNTIN